jgi:hypothetical protein
MKLNIQTILKPDFYLIKEMDFYCREGVLLVYAQRPFISVTAVSASEHHAQRYERL